MHAAHECMSYEEEEDTCMPYEDEDTCSLMHGLHGFLLYFFYITIFLLFKKKMTCR